jgi:MYXO-CTERM domain-containing protein
MKPGRTRAIRSPGFDRSRIAVTLAGVFAGAAILGAGDARASCPQLLQNNEFSDGTISPWQLSTSPPDIDPTVGVSSDQYMTLDISTMDTSAFANPTGALSQPVAIQYGGRYRVTFYMYTSGGTSAHVSIGSATSSVTYGLNDDLTTSQMASSATQQFTFVANTADPDAVFTLSFPLGSYVYYKFDSLFVEDISDVPCSGPVGGQAGAGGAMGTGGVVGTGGTGGAGGATAVGGATGTGNTSGTGGAVGTGGSAGSSGDSGTGGIIGTGGTGAGGTTSIGGATGTGGQVGIGGGGGATGVGGASAGGNGGSAMSGAAGRGGVGPAGLTCVPGSQISCACPGGPSAPHGVQVCDAQGTGYVACIGCPNASVVTSSGDGGCGCSVGAPGGARAIGWTLALLALTLGRRASRRKRPGNEPHK